MQILQLQTLLHEFCDVWFFSFDREILNQIIFLNFLSASEHPYKGIFTSLPKTGGGEFGKFYSLPALNDPRIGMHPNNFAIIKLNLYKRSI